MKNLSLNVKAELASRSEVGALLALPGDAVIIRRGPPRWMIIKCPCGCGDEIPINLDRRAGKAWRLYEGGIEGATLFPSVWRDTDCQSHFIVWRGRILLLGAHENDETSAIADVLVLLQRLRSAWPSTGFASYLEVADELSEIPWDVLEACRRLVDKGVLVEGTGPQRGTFRRR